jgi:DnaK suppressor protein
MVSSKKFPHFRQRLLERRNRIFETHEEIHEERLSLHEPEIERVETAQKEKLAQIMDQLDQREKDELEAIDQALARIEAGGYGICESCGKRISIKRLESVPWTKLCNRCGKDRESQAPSETPEKEIVRPSPLPPDYQGLSDEEIVEGVMDTLQTDGRVETDELQIRSQDGILYLAGFLPSEKKRQILLQIIHDTLGFQDVVDEISVDPVLWEREDRTPDEKLKGQIEDERLPVPPAQQSDFAADDAPMVPPDELIPEDTDR